jgi:hypothetical protein
VLADVDGDGDLDVVGTSAGTDDEVVTHSTDPTDADSDHDAVDDGTEVAFQIDPNDPDTDGDGVCDGSVAFLAPLCDVSSLPGELGGDNCPGQANAGQGNSDALTAGDVCQCGDVTGDFVVDETDVERLRELLVGATLGGAYDADRCNVSDPVGGVAGECNVSDIFVLDRYVSGGSATVVQFRSPAASALRGLLAREAPVSGRPSAPRSSARRDPLPSGVRGSRSRPRLAAP